MCFRDSPSRGLRYTHGVSKLAFAVALVTVAAATAHAAPAKTPKGAATRAFACLKTRCNGAGVFTDKALKEWGEIRALLGTKLVFKNVRLIATLPGTVSSRMHKRWKRAIDELAQRGYSKAALLRLGAGRGVVRIGPNSAMALVGMQITAGKRSRDEYVMFSIVKQGTGWLIAFIEDSPRKHVRFWKKRRP